VIRVATDADIAAMVSMGEKFHAFSGETVPYCRASAEKTVRGLMGVGFILIAEADGLAFGMIGVAIIPLFFNFSAHLAQELMWWVDEEHRGSGAALALIHAAEDESRSRGAVRLLMAHLSNSPPHVASIYDRLGYKPRESMFAKEL